MKFDFPSQTTPERIIFSFSNLFATPTGNNIDRKYVGRLDNVLLIKVNLPPFD
jgi:hypothetical protein